MRMRKRTARFKKSRPDMSELKALAQVVCRALKVSKRRIAVAESCTGGALCSTLTSLPECGAPLEQGFITYTKEAKIRALQIDKTLFDSYGVISPECAKAMAEGARTVAKTDYGIGITGVAGPDTSEDKPVGLVFIGCASDTETVIKQLQFGNLERDEIREKASYEALVILRDTVC
jgi:PncC family amidohydrolase